MTTTAACGCGVETSAPSAEEFPDAYLAHVRAEHPDWPFPDLAVRIVGEALLRLTGGTERLPEVGAVEVHPVMPDRLDDWLAFMDHDAFVDKPWVASCYCIEQHCPLPPPALGVWEQNRSTMADLFRDGKAFGYLAYVDRRPGGWVNAALRADQRYALGRDDDGDTITVSCFNIAPPYRAHGLASALLDAVIADAPGRARRIEAFPARQLDTSEMGEGNYRGPLSLFLSRGFTVVKERATDAVVRLDVERSSQG